MPAEAPLLLLPRQAAKELNVIPSNLKSMYPYLHCLRLPSNAISHRRFPAAYIDALNGAFDSELFANNVEVGRWFAATELARAAIAGAEQGVERALDDASQNGLLTRQAAGSILNVDWKTIWQWNQDTLLDEVVTSDDIYIPTDALREACIWERPLGYSDISE